ncbi:MAG: HAD family hydrolase [Polyangiaceae bacterium]
MTARALESFVAGVRLLSLDAGNTVIFMDHARIARIVAEAGEKSESGSAVTTETLVRCEGEAKRLLDDGYGERPRWEFEGRPGGLGWGKMIGTMLVQAGIDRSRVPQLLARLWASHMELNLWWVVPEGMGPALDAIRALGVKVVLVSNSEGTHEAFFTRLGIRKYFDLLVDSGKVGVEKPDPGIWQIALAAYPTPPDQVLHLGDTYATDIAGAKALGFRAGLIDPFGHYEGRHLDVQRVPGVIEVADAIVRSASRFPPVP